MATPVKFESYVEEKNKGTHVWGTDVFKIALTNTAPTAATDTVLLTGSLHPAPAAANGYAAGTTTTAISEASGTATVTGTQVVFTAAAGQIGPFRYSILYNSSKSDKLVMYLDRGASLTLEDTETHTEKFNNASPGTIFTDT